jgi:hypothetical protein
MSIEADGGAVPHARSPKSSHRAPRDPSSDRNASVDTGQVHVDDAAGEKPMRCFNQSTASANVDQRRVVTGPYPRAEDAARRCRLPV